MKDPAERAAELLHADGVWRHGIDRPPDRRRDENPLDQTDHVVPMDPGHPLGSWGNRSAEERTKRKEHLRQRATVLCQDHSEPGTHDADAHGFDLLRLTLPCDAQLGEEPFSRAGILVKEPVSARSVIAYSRGAD